jgi:hypothetical protein
VDSSNASAIPPYFRVAADDAAPHSGMRLHTVASFDSLEGHVVAMLKRLDLPNDRYGVPYFNLAIFPNTPGIGGRNVVDWHYARMTRSHGYEFILRKYTELQEDSAYAWREMMSNYMHQMQPLESLREAPRPARIVEDDESEDPDVAFKVAGSPWFHCVCGASAGKWKSVAPSEGIGNRKIWEPMPEGIVGDAWLCPCGRVYAWAEYGGGTYKPHRLQTIDKGAIRESDAGPGPWEIRANDGSRRRWRILRYFEYEDGVLFLAGREDYNSGDRGLANIGLFPRIEGIGGRYEIDWSHVKLGTTSYYLDLEARFMYAQEDIRRGAVLREPVVHADRPLVPVTTRHFGERAEEGDSQIAENADVIIFSSSDHGGWVCPCGGTEGWATVRPVEGIGDRATGAWEEVEPAQRIHSEHWMCARCGRVFVWSVDESSPIGRMTQVTQIDPKSVTYLPPDDYAPWPWEGPIEESEERAIVRGGMMSCICGGAITVWASPVRGIGDRAIWSMDPVYDHTRHGRYVGCTACGRIYDKDSVFAPVIDKISEDTEERAVVKFGHFYCPECGLTAPMDFARRLHGIGDRAAGWEPGIDDTESQEAAYCTGCGRVFQRSGPYPVIGRIGQSDRAQ